MQRPNVCAVGPTLCKCYTNVLCLPGSAQTRVFAGYTMELPVDKAGYWVVTTLRGFVKLKKIHKSEKNSEVGGWVRPQLG